MEEWGTIEVEITGVTPLLMHNPASMSAPKAGIKKREAPDPEVEADKAAYWSSNGHKALIIQDKHIKACMVNAAKGYRTGVGRKALRPLIAAQTRVEPFEIDLGTDKYEIDIQGVVIQRARVLRARPKIWPWKAKFNILYHLETFLDTDILKEIVKSGGLFVGLLDFRPEKCGSYGQFKISGWKDKS